MTGKQWSLRIAIYAVGIVVLAMGVTLCTKADIGISSISSVPFAIANAFGWSFPKTMFCVYTLIVGIQFLVRGKHRQWKDLFQIPFSVVFSSFLDWFETLIDLHYDLLWQNLLLAVASIVLMGVGVSLIVNMDFVPNPPDGMTQAFSWRTGLSMGLTKNLLDLVFATLTITIDLVFTGRISSVGIGTVFCVIFIGRIIAVFDYFFKDKMMRAVGLSVKTFKKSGIEAT